MKHVAPNSHPNVAAEKPSDGASPGRTSESERSEITTDTDRLKAAIAELGGIQSLLVTGELDPRILIDFRDAISRVRNASWAAYQYAELKITGKDSTSIISILASERIRVAYQLCQAIEKDLATADIHLQTGQLIQLHTAAKSLTNKLNSVVSRVK